MSVRVDGEEVFQDGIDDNESVTMPSPYYAERLAALLREGYSRAGAIEALGYEIQQALSTLHSAQRAEERRLERGGKDPNAA